MINGNGHSFPFTLEKAKTRGAEVAVKYVLDESSGYLSAMFAPKMVKNKEKDVKRS